MHIFPQGYYTAPQRYRAETAYTFLFLRTSVYRGYTHLWNIHWAAHIHTRPSLSPWSHHTAVLIRILFLPIPFPHHGHLSSAKGRLWSTPSSWRSTSGLSRFLCCPSHIFLCVPYIPGFWSHALSRTLHGHWPGFPHRILKASLPLLHPPFLAAPDTIPYPLRHRSWQMPGFHSSCQM